MSPYQIAGCYTEDVALLLCNVDEDSSDITRNRLYFTISNTSQQSLNISGINIRQIRVFPPNPFVFNVNKTPQIRDSELFLGELITLENTANGIGDETQISSSTFHVPENSTTVISLVYGYYGHYQLKKDLKLLKESPMSSLVPFKKQERARAVGDVIFTVSYINWETGKEFHEVIKLHIWPESKKNM